MRKPLPPEHFSADRCLHELFVRQAQLTPTKVALRFGNEQLTYGELDQQSTQLAARLQAHGVGVEDFVVVYCERSFEMIVAILAILKAGAAYVPIDVNYPAERMAFMVEDAGAGVLLTQRRLVERLPQTGATVICLDEVLPDNCPPYTPPAVEPHHLAYMIYTSGSTGKPKGVMITHENLCYQLQGQHAIAPDPIEAMLLTVSISFDVSVLTIFWTLLQGATLVLPEQGAEKDMRRLAETIRRHRISHTMTLPSPYTLLLEQAPPGALDSLRLVNVSGEVCPVSLAQRHEALLPHAQLYNLYGPTEATVNCTCFPFPKGFDALKAPIGKPIRGYEIFILDENLREVPHGEVGEIYIGGQVPVVGRGYWNRPELTAERFISRPDWLGMPAHPRARTLYKTGDLARWMPDGNIEFLGRADFQVKFRGFRIELGEIEAVLARHPAVKEVVVQLRNQHDLARQRLVAWLTLHDGQAVTVSELHAHLLSFLPEYMVPSQFVFLEKMPLTTNGKFDRKALPDPPAERPPLAVEYQPPRDALERYIARQWESLLGLAPVGRHDRFFELGGNSILAARFLGALMEAMDTSIFITSIFDHPTPASLAAFLRASYPDEVARLLGQQPGQRAIFPKDKPAEGLTPAVIERFPSLVPRHLTEESVRNGAGDERVTPLFILAPPRSGTTLLRVMLAGHPGIFACNELQLLHFETLRQRREAYTGKFRLWTEGLIRAVMELRQLDADAAQAFLNELADQGTTTAEMFHLLQEWSGGRIVADKSPSYALDPLALRKALADFPKARFIQLVRHPWSMVRSFEKYHMEQVLYLRDHDLPARQLAELVWLHSHRHITEFLHAVPTGQKSILRYEDLVAEPEPTLRRMCQELGIPFHEALLDPYAELERKMVDGIYAESRSMGDTHFVQKKAIDERKAEEWRGVLDDDFLSDATWQLAATLGYDLPPHRLSGGSAASAVFLKNEKTAAHALPVGESAPRAEQSATLERQPPAQWPSAQEGFSSKNVRHRPIAIVGMACRVAGARNLDEFWELLTSGRDPGIDLSDADLEAEGITNPEPNRVRRSYALHDPYAFDHNFFGIHPREAACMDPQHRHFLELAWETLESAGYDPARYAGRIGLFGGVARNTYFLRNVLAHPDLLQMAGEYQEMLASDSSFSVTRVAYKLGLTGPAVNVQTACSTGGVALHLACQSLLAGDCDMVLVGGGRIQSPVRGGYPFTEGGPLSARGRLRAFDADADGMVQGHGMAMLLLKPLDRALADGDHIWAVIRATAVNNDGADKTGLTAPSSAGQAAVIEEALRRAGVSAEDISYVEAHGTGTRIGDPIEIQGLTTAFRKFTDKRQFCAVGSVKTNVGHLDAGACLIGVIKTALALYHETLPPSLHFEKPNPQIDFERSPFFVLDSLRPWPRTDEPRRAGVSSFGLGGTNAHVILEEAPIRAPLPESYHPELLLLSARSESVLERLANDWQQFFTRNNPPNLAAAAATAALGRRHFSHRAAFVLEPAAGWPRAVASGKVEPGSRELVFLFPGGGAQYVNMGRGLYDAEPVFRHWMDVCFELLKKDHEIDLQPRLYPADASRVAPIEAPALGLAALFAVEYAMAQLWMHRGLAPAALLGHSMGEYTAACLAGVMDLPTALGLVAVRGKLFESLPATGAMLSVPLSETELQPFLDADHCISVVNRHDSLVVSSTAEGIERLQRRLEAEGVECTPLHIAVAAHSPQVEPVLDAFAAYLQTAHLQPPRIPLVSNVTGTWLTAEQATSVEYWLRHLRQTVRFHQGLQTLFESEGGPRRIFLETGPGQTLAGLARLHPARKGQPVLHSIRHPREVADDRAVFLRTLGHLWVLGCEIDWERHFEHEQWRRVPLPTYPFEKHVHFLPPLATRKQTAAAPPITETNTPHTPLPEPLHSMSQTPVNRRQKLMDELRGILYELSGMEPASMDAEVSFLELGFDSLFLSQAVIQFNKRFGTKLSFRALFEEVPTIAALAAHLDEVLPADHFGPEPESVPSQGASTSMAPLAPPQPAAGVLGENEGNLLAIVQQQLNLMQQQLDLLRASSAPGAGTAPNMTSAASAPQPQIPVPTPPTNAETEEPTIVRKTKGVTPKLSSYARISTLDDLPPRQRQGLEDFMKRYVEKTAASKALQQRHRQYYADPRSVTGFSKLWKEIVYQIGLKRSKGSKIWDIDGNEYIDYVMSYGVALFGHMPDFVEEAVSKALARGNSLDVLPPEATEVARIICELSGMDRVTLANTGTEAVLGAVRAARTITGKERIAVFDTDYHGMIDQFLVRGVHLRDHSRALPASPGVPAFLVENNLVLDYDDPHVLDKLRSHIHELAAVLIEPVQAQNPHWQHDELIGAVREITRQHDVPLIFDEIINGFRLAPRGAQAWYGVEADIVAYGKSISGGLPLAAVAGKARYMDAFDGGFWQYGDDSSPEGLVTYFAGTFIKNPISVAAAHAALQELQRRSPELQQELNERTEAFARRIRQIFLDTRAPFMIQSCASIFMIKTADTNPLSRLFHYFLRLRGVNIRERPCFVSTAHTEADFERTYEAFEAAIEDMYEAGLIEPWDGEDLNVVVPPRHRRSADYPLTAGQEEIFVTDQISPAASLTYNVGTEIRLKGNLDRQALEQALQNLLNRHEALRMTFRRDGSRQKPLSELRLELPFTDLRTQPPDARQRALQHLHVQETETPFDLEKGPPVRFHLVAMADEDHRLLFTVHHIAVDGWSLGLLTRDLGRLYARACGRPTTLPAVKQLGDFALEYHALRQSDAYARHLEFWEKRLSPLPPQLELPTDHKRPPVRSWRCGVVAMRLEQARFQRITAVAARHGTTFFSYVLAAFGVFLHRLSAQDDFLLGIIAAGHNLPGNEQLVGHAANLLPLRLQPQAEASFADYLKRVRSLLLDAFEHQQITLGDLATRLALPRDPSRPSPVSVLFNLDSPLDNLDFGPLVASTRPIARRYETFDLFVNVRPLPAGKGLELEWNFNADLWEQATMERWLQSFATLLEATLEKPDQPLASLPLMDAEAFSRWMLRSQGPAMDFPKNTTLHGLFERQVALTPDATAVSCGDERLSFAELDAHANRLARYFASKGLQPGQYAAVLLERSAWLPAVLLGILKAGAAYLPLDPANPSERLRFLLTDSGARLLVTERTFENLLSDDLAAAPVFLDQERAAWQAQSAEPIAAETSAMGLAYMIYTSGSTGRPKGVPIRHLQAVHLVHAMQRELDFGPGETVFNVISFTFDPSVLDLFMTLGTGGHLVLATQTAVKNAWELMNQLEATQPTLMQATPATWQMLVSAGWQGLPQLKIVSGGEALDRTLARELLRRGAHLWNAYGPTETTIYTIVKKVTAATLEEPHRSGYVPIGRPLPNTTVFLLDAHRQPVPDGVPGEIYIQGLCVAEGYHAQPERTVEAFLGLPDFPNGKLYKTGDLAVRHPNGDIEYLGRIDNQVKLRGYRIEPGEIEACLRKMDGVQEAAVVLRTLPNGEQGLVAYVVRAAGSNGLPFREFLLQYLPEYMVPAVFIDLDAMPLTATGKIDRRALPAPRGANLSKEKAFEEPSRPLERQLAAIWQELLGVERVGLHDNFFELGGHSLLAVRLLAVIEERMGVRLPLVALAGGATLADLAARLEQVKKPEPPSVPAQPLAEDVATVPLTEGQREIFVSHHLSQQAAVSFNIGSELRLVGAIDAEALQWAIRTLAQRHEALRTAIDAGGEVQHIQPAAMLEPRWVNLSVLDESARQSRLDEIRKEMLHQPFDLTQAPLARCTVVKCSDEEHVVLFVMHHIVLDGWSVGVLMDELGRLYGIESGYDTRPLPKAQQLSDYARHQAELKHSPEYQRARRYWQARFASGWPAMSLPADVPAHYANDLEAASLQCHFSKSFKEKAQQVAASAGTTLYTLMLAAFQAWLSRWCGQRETLVGVAVSGKSIVEWENLVAHRTHLLPLYMQVDWSLPFSKHLQQVNHALLEAFDHQAYTLGNLARDLHLRKRAEGVALLPVVFNMETMERPRRFGPLALQSDFLEGPYKLYDLLVQLKPDGEGGLLLKWFYRKALFSPETLRLRLEGFAGFLEKMLDDLAAPIEQLPLMTDAERDLLVRWGQGPHMPWPPQNGPRTLHTWLTLTATRRPDAVAVSCGEQSLTFGELENRANAIANLLIHKGFRPGSFAGVLMEQSIDILPAIYGILKAGGAYVPLDASNPPGRLQAIAADAGLTHLLIHAQTLHRSFAIPVQVLVLDTIDWSEPPAGPPPVSVSPDAPAYVIYTSGSTGQPKGVVIRHDSALHTLFAIDKHLELREQSVIFSVSSMAFDMSVPDYFLPAIKGARLVLATAAERKDGFLLAEALTRHQPTHMQATPATWRLLLLSGWQGDAKLCAIAGGEALPRELAMQLLQHCGVLWNGYGPTECTIYATYQRVDAELLGRQPTDAVPIGRPIANVCVRIEDKPGSLAPAGVPGELLISGPGVSEGYLHQPKLTGRSFFTDAQGLRWYRTGDLVKWLPTGEIAFLGRLDAQVKLRGFRIELGEIEAALNLMPGVEAAAAGLVTDPAGEPQLAAWVVLDEPTLFDEKQCREFLRKKLPPYMVPTVYVPIDTLPLNNSLKVDRQALPAPSWERCTEQSPEQKPASPLETLLERLWCQVLGLEHCGIDEDFFELGGHSLSAVKLLSLVHQETGRQLPLTVLFRHGTIRRLAQLLDDERKGENAFSSLVPIRPGTGKLPLYLVHGGGLHVLFYQSLVQHLAPDQPIYALQALGLDGRSEPLDSIEAMAAHYISEIRRVQPQGPYLLAGYSLGGIVAWEMAHQLLQDGQQVPFLAMFDAVAKEQTSTDSGGWRKKLHKTGFNLALLLKNPRAAVEYKAQMLRNRLENLTGKFRVAYLNTKTRQVEEGYLPFGKAVYEKSLEAYHKYVLKPLDIAVDLFKAREQMFFVADPQTYGWRKFARRGVRVHVIDGNHLTLFSREHARQIARIVQTRLDEIAMDGDAGN